MNDSSLERPQIQLEAIKEKIMSGTLDVNTIHQAMLTEITKELEKPLEEVDMDYVNACQALLTSLNSSRAAAIESHYDSNLEAIRRRLRRDRHCFVPVRPLRLATAFCLSALLLLGGVLFFQNNVEISMTPNEEQLIVQGIDPSDDTVSHANEASSGSHGLYTTENWDEAIALFESTPDAPTWLPSGWSVVDYRIALLDTYKRITITYQDETHNERLVFTEKVYIDIEAYRSEIEQNAYGYTTTLESGTTVYITKNFELTTTRWQRDKRQFTLYGSIDESDLLRCIESTETLKEE